MKTIGLIPGGMKPFHKGHDFIMQEAMRDCDEVILFTSAKTRGIIKGSNMVKAWNELIQPLLPRLDRIEFVRSPVGGVYTYLETEGMPENEYRIYAGIEEVNRFRPDYLARILPDLFIIQPATLDPERYDRKGSKGVDASGTAVRNAIEAGNFRLFKSYLPDYLKPHASEYLSILLS
tara:strand:- start:2153 stop:2683 length:531 start_codon:yes stop_codon:yes gene_type:complete